MEKPGKNAHGPKHAGHGHDDHGDGHGDGGHDDHGGGGHCPPPWILTFADMSVLLMAFFVIMLMTAKTDQPKFNAFAAVMRQTFGQVPLDPNDADKGGTSILDLKFGPQSGEQTEEPPGTRPQSGDPDTTEGGKGSAGDGASGSAQPDGVDEAAEALAKAMRDAVAQGEITVEGDGGKVVVRLPSGTGAEAAQKIADAIAEAAGTGEGNGAAASQGAGGEGQGADGAQSGAGEGAEGQDPGAAASSGGAAGDAGAAEGQGAGQSEGEGAGQDGSQTEGQSGASAEGEGSATTEGDAQAGPLAGEGKPGGMGRGLIRAKLAAMQAGLLLESEMAEGAVGIEQRDGSVVVTLGAGGAFSSGSADITAEAQAIIADLQQVSDKATRIVITGHTDNVPLAGGQYRDNWDLASARASAVLREITDSGLVPDAELVAQSMGDTQPIADNATPEGREKNRRVEIEIEFEEETTE